MKKLNIGYFADGPWSHKAFQKLIKDPEIVISFICVRFDTEDEILKKYSKIYNISYLKHENINSEQFISKIKDYNCDLFVSMSFNQIFKNKVINLPKYKTINCHAGKLPYYRGRNVLNWVLINDEKEFGITVHYVDQGIDTGDIILQKVYDILDEDNYKTLLDKAHEGCAEILYEVILKFKKGSVKSFRQTEFHPTGFYCSQRKDGDEIICWNQSSRKIFNFVRAICNPGPIARSFIKGKEIKINKVELIKNAPSYECIVGAVLIKKNDSFLVKTKDSFIKIIEYDYDGIVRVGDRLETK